MPFFPIGGGTGIGATGVVSGDNGGDFSTTSAAFVDVGVQLSNLAVSTGDKILVVCKFVWFQNLTGIASFFALTTGAPNTIDQVIYASEVANDRQAGVMANLYTVVAGDISGGVMLIKMRYASDGVRQLTISNSSSNVPRIMAVNLRH